MDKKALIKKWTPSPLTLILLGLIAWLWFRPPAKVSDEVIVTAPWSVTLPDGRELTSDSLRGKVVLVNFWATWCPYCRKEKPVIESFWQDYKGKGFEVISISVDDTPEKIAAWMQDKGYASMAAPSNASVRMAFGDVSSVPTSFIVDTDGNIRHRIGGQVHYPRLKKLVEPLLAASAATK
jgi:thiol-disulfide isomerase/thioredoxin